MNCSRLDKIILIVFFISILGNIVYNNNYIFKKDDRLSVVIANDKNQTVEFDLFENRVIRINGKLGESIIKIENKKAFFVESVCRDKICVKHGAISKPDQIVACLPNGILLKISVKDKNKDNVSIDAIAK